MGTCNFRDNEYIDLYVTHFNIDFDEVKEELKQEGIYTDEELDDDNFIYQYMYDTIDLYYQDVIDTFDDDIRLALKHFNRELMFFELELKSGYYDGIQISEKFIDNSYYNKYTTLDPRNLDNNDCNYLFDMCRSKAIRKFDSEVKFINNKLLPYLSQQTSFKKLYHIGTFSNGEGVYQWA